MNSTYETKETNHRVEQTKKKEDTNHRVEQTKTSYLSNKLSF